MKKILFISPLPPPHYGSAISSKMCFNILNNSPKFIVKSLKLNYSETMDDVGNFSFKKIFGFFTVILKATYLERNFKPDIIYFMPATAGLALFRDALILRFLRRNTIIHLRSRFIETDYKNIIKLIFIKWILRANKVILIGKELITNLNGLVDDSRISILPNAIPHTLSDKEYSYIIKIKKTNNTINLLFLSNMIESKGWYKVLETCALLRLQNLDFKCHFVGAWSTKNDEILFLEFVNKNNLSENVIHHGKLTGIDKNQILAISDIMLFPTEYQLETFGRVIIEAMEYGIPVVANGIGTIPSTIEDKITGIVLKKNDIYEIADAINLLSEPKYREKISHAARERFLKNYTLKTFKPNFLQLIEKSIF